jgi:type IV secretion system protein VirB10
MTQIPDFSEDSASQEPRTMPSLHHTSSNIGQKMILFTGALIVLLALIAVNGGFSSEKTPAKPEKITIRNHLGKAPDLPLMPVSSVPPPLMPEVILHTGELVPPAPNYPKIKQSSDENQEQSPEDRKIASALISYKTKSTSQNEKIPSPETEISAEESDDFGKQLQVARLTNAKASLLPDRHLFITKGTFMPCVLETAISSDVAGMTSCRLSQHIYSTSGRIVLLEKGTKIVGEYKGSVERGVSRLFVLWNRAETPQGVLIDLGSGGADSLGRAGHEGNIDSHFWDRFSSAMMLSFIDDMGAYLSQQASGTPQGQVQFSNSSGRASDAISIALENSINIRPTFYKNQGDLVNIFIARDLDFRGVYALTAE